MEEQRKKCGVVTALILGLGLMLITAQVLLNTDGRHDVVPVVVSVSSEHAEHYNQCYNLSRKVLPQCIIAGVRKCGTRALLEFLGLHSDIQIADREINFFDKDESYSRGLEWYRQQMPRSEPHQLTLEKTPHYFVDEKTPALMRHMNSSIRILFIVRDPVVRMISQYVQATTHKFRNETNLPKFEELAVDRISGEVNRKYLPLQISLYHVHLKRWLKYFNRTQIHIVDGDMLISDPPTELRKIETFLQIEHQLSADKFYFNASRGFYCKFIGRESICLSRGKGRQHPRVEQKVLDTLCQFFKSHNQIFYEMIGQNFTWC